MKKTSLFIFAILSLVSSLCFAVTPVVCVNMTNNYTNAALSSSPIVLAVTLMDGNEIVEKMVVKTVDGESVPVEIGTDTSYTNSVSNGGGKVTIIPGVIHEGVSMLLTPIITKGGKIHVSLFFNKINLLSIQSVTQKNGDTVQVPKTTSFDINQNLLLDSGKETAIQFGPDVDAAGKPTKPQYTLLLTATKI
jgi:hypothetical protein